MDSISATQRLTFGILELCDGVGLIPAIMGLFGVAEVIANVEQEIKRELVTDQGQESSAHPPGLAGFFLAHDPRDRSSGFFIGLLPGPAPVISSFSSYAIEKKLSKTPGKIRDRHDRGGGRARVGQQRRLGRGLHSPLHSGDPVQLRRRHSLGRLDDPRHSARTHADHEVTRTFSGAPS